MTEAMPFLQKYDITFLRPPTICHERFSNCQKGIPFRQRGLQAGKRLSAAYAGMRRYSRARSSVASASLTASGSRNGSTHFASTTPSVIAPVRV